MFTKAYAHYKAAATHERFTMEQPGSESVAHQRDVARASEMEAWQRVAELESALKRAIAVAEEARQEWDAAPSGMRAGKLLIALGGNCKGYRADNATLAKAKP